MTGVSGGPGAISDPGRRPLSRVCRRRGRGAGWPPAPPDARSADPEGTLHPCPAPTLLSCGAGVSHFSHPPRDFLDFRDRAAGQGPALGAVSLLGRGQEKESRRWVPPSLDGELGFALSLHSWPLRPGG